MTIKPTTRPFSTRTALAAPCAALLVLLALPKTGQAQAVNDSASDQTVKLPQFNVSGEQTSTYSAEEATSVSRVSQPITDIPQTVSVVTRALMDDTQGFRMLDSAQYVTPITQSSLAEGGDRYNLRGFQISQRFIDGVNVSGVDGYSISSDTSNVERLEIVKGPDAILVPGGSPGGIVNQITKSPYFSDGGYVSLSYKEYLQNEATVDVNRVLDDKKTTAVRVVFSLEDQTDGYYINQFRKGWLFAPSITHNFGNGVTFTSKLETFYIQEGQAYGSVLDPSVGTTTGGWAKIPSYIPKDWSWGSAADDVNRRRWETRWLNELDYKIGSNTSARLWLMVDHATRDDQGASSGTPVAGTQGSYNPLTGNWVPFTNYTYNAATHTVTATPLTPSTNLQYIRSGQANLLKFDEAHIKNDYATVFQPSSWLTSTSIYGISANYQRLTWKNWTATNPENVDFANLAATANYNPALTYVSSLNDDKAAAQIDGQEFLYQRFNLFKDRVILAGGISEFEGVLTRLDGGNLPLTNAAPNYYPDTLTARVTDLNAGLIVKIIPDLSYYAGFNRVGGALPSSITAGTNPKNFLIEEGYQLETGLKGSYLDGRFTFSSAVFYIHQNNFEVANAAFNTDPTQPQFLYYDFTSQGVEAESSMLITKDLSLVGNATHYQMRSSFGAPYRMVPDNSAALFLKYEFHDTPLSGLGLSIGSIYESKQAGDQATGLSVAGVPLKPSFYLAPRTLTQAGISYKYGIHWVGRLLVDNLTNVNYIEAAGSRTSIVPGLPRSFTGTLEYRF